MSEPMNVTTSWKPESANASAMTASETSHRPRSNFVRSRNGFRIFSLRSSPGPVVCGFPRRRAQPHPRRGLKPSYHRSLSRQRPKRRLWPDWNALWPPGSPSPLRHSAGAAALPHSRRRRSAQERLRHVMSAGARVLRQDAFPQPYRGVDILHILCYNQYMSKSCTGRLPCES